MQLGLNGKKLRGIFAGGLAGWVLDAYDLSAMFLLVPVIAVLFFPSGNLILAIIGAFAIYFISLVFRPVGGLLFGRFADKRGRKIAMVVTLSGLGVIIFATGLLPTYAQVGIIAPVFLALFRMITGIFAGGEYGNSSSIVTESVNTKYRGRIGSLLQGGYPIGYAMAAGVFLTLRSVYGSAFISAAYGAGWRVFFFIGIVPVIVGLIIRLKMPESYLWSDIKKKKKLDLHPIKTVFTNKQYRHSFFLGVLAMTGIAWVYSLTLGFFPTTLPEFFGIGFPNFLYIVIVAILTSLLGYFSSGYISDKIGRKKALYIFSGLAIILAFPTMYGMFTGAYGILMAGFLASLLAFVTTGAYGVIPAYLSEKFPTKVRGTGVGISFNGGFIVGSWSSVIVLAAVGAVNPLTNTTNVSTLHAALGSFWWITAIGIVIGELLILTSALLSKETYKADLSKIN